MKFWTEKEHPDEAEVRRLEQWLRTTTRSQDRPVAGDPYWGRLTVKTNDWIDRVTSPRALSVSWLARVAIPGAVAVFSFIVALHYYAPVAHTAKSSLYSELAAMSESEVDSLLVAEASIGELTPASEVGTEVFRVPRDQIAEYFVANGKESQLVEAMGEEQANAFLDRLK